jgi:hypothetical protein
VISTVLGQEGHDVCSMSRSMRANKLELSVQVYVASVRVSIRAYSQLYTNVLYAKAVRHFVARVRNEDSINWACRQSTNSRALSQMK